MGGLGPRVIFHIWQRCISGRRGSTAAADAGGAAARRERPIDGDGGGGFGRDHEEDERVDRRKICDRRLSQACAAGNGASERTERTSIWLCSGNSTADGAYSCRHIDEEHALGTRRPWPHVRARQPRSSLLVRITFLRVRSADLFRLLRQCMAHRRSSAAGGARQREQLRGRVENRLNSSR